MRATPELIFALRRAAVRILDPAEDYDWMSTTKCNCGLLVREICGLNEEQLLDIQIRSYTEGCWTTNAERCKETGLPITYVIETLRDIGLTPDDFNYIEHCNNAISAEFKNARFVSNFFLNLANELESQLPQHQHHIRIEDNECTTPDRTSRIPDESRVNSGESHKS